MSNTISPKLQSEIDAQAIFLRALVLGKTPIADDPDHSLFNEYKKYMDQLELVWGEEKLKQKLSDVKTVYQMIEAHS